MLFKCCYGCHDMNQYQNMLFQTSSLKSLLGKLGKFDLEYSFSEWGKNHCHAQYQSYMFLVDIPNKYIFNLLLEDKLPKMPTIYMDYRENKLYVCKETLDIKYFNSGTVASSSNSKHVTKFFEWEKDEEDLEPSFRYEIPFEDFQDIYDIIKPYIEYDFNYKIEKVINSFPDLRKNENIIYSGLLSDYKDKKDKKELVINSESSFWDFLVYDIFNGEFTKEYEKRFPRRVDILKCHIAKFQSYFLETGETDYDPFIKK